ncbi:hypothetical protein KKH82_02965 [Patescibacteria group bacterium]|nr:hypothetical protein [Patescibacteria group bacterium]
MIKFKRRNEDGLHCRFCNNIYNDINRLPHYIDLYETSPIKGIVCEHCKKHLENYTNSSPSDAKKVCPMCNDTGEMEDLVNGKRMKIKCEKCSPS